MSFVSSHLDRVTDDNFSRDPVGDTVSICEQLLEVIVGWRPLTFKQTTALCWWDMLRHISGGRENTEEEKSVCEFIPETMMKS